MSLILDGSNGLSDVDGTAATPAIRGTDANTGIFFPAADTIAFSEGGAEAMRIDGSGNLGIGTNNPATKLDVAGNLRFSAGNPVIELNNGGPQIYSTSANTLQFATGGGIGSPTERMRIDSSGNTFIGGTTGFGRLVVNASGSDIYLGYNGATKQFAVADNGQIYAQFTSITSLSDRRVKENIKPIQYGLDAVTKLNPVTFNFIAYPELQPTYGFIAQEVEPILPELVDDEKDNKAEDGTPYKTLKMGDMLPILVKAIQELKATVDAQAAQIAALENPPVESATNE
jgi:hypothetical protein